MQTTQKRTTVYFDPNLLKALQFKSIELGKTVSELVNDSVSSYLAEDAEDLEAFTERVNEPLISYEAFLRDLKADGRL